MTKSTHDAIRRAREAAGLSQVELARRAGISRQALGAIESGTYQPGVSVALSLARELGESVESLFGDSDGPRVSATWVGERRVAPRARVVLGRVNGRVIAVPQSPGSLSLAPAGGIVEQASGKVVSVETFLSREEIDSTMLLAGCDPGVSILADYLGRRRASVRIVALTCSSRAALRALADRRVHAAGTHIRDPRTGEYNLASTRRLLGDRRATLINFACWEMGLAIHPSARQKIRSAADLAAPGVRIANREAGSGARLALDEALSEAGVDTGALGGYGHELRGHLEVAAAVSAGEADAGITIKVAAEAYGLGFIALREERYDLLVPESEMELPAVAATLDALNSSRFARELSELCGYDTSRTGTVMASGASVAGG